MFPYDIILIVSSFNSENLSNSAARVIKVWHLVWQIPYSSFIWGAVFICQICLATLLHFTTSPNNSLGCIPKKFRKDGIALYMPHLLVVASIRRMHRKDS